MTKQKTGFGSRRGFLARLAAMGTVLGGVVPELRAYGMTGSTPWTPPNMGSTPGMDGSTAMPTNPSMAPTTPNYQSDVPGLSPSASALLYSSALTDPDVRALLAHVERGATIMPAQSSADLGSGGKIIKLPVRGPTGATTAVIMFGRAQITTQSGQNIPVPIRLLLKSDGTSMVANQGKAVPTPPDTAEAIKVLYRMTFPTEAAERQIAATANQRQSMQSQPAPTHVPQAPWEIRPTFKSCASDYWTCMRASIDAKNNAFWMGICVVVIVICGLVAVIYAPVVATIGATRIIMSAPFAVAAASEVGARLHDDVCNQIYSRCMSRAIY